MIIDKKYTTKKKEEKEITKTRKWKNRVVK